MTSLFVSVLIYKDTSYDTNNNTLSCCPCDNNIVGIPRRNSLHWQCSQCMDAIACNLHCKLACLCSICFVYYWPVVSLIHFVGMLHLLYNVVCNMPILYNGTLVPQLLYCISYYVLAMLALARKVLPGT